MKAALRLRELFEVAEAPGHTENTDATPDAGRGGIRFGLDRRSLAALSVIALGGLVLAGAVVLRSQPHVTAVPAAAVLATGSPIPVPGAPGTAGPPPGSPGPSPGLPAELLVDVQGRVRHPGVVQLPAGSRVMDALAAAGGPRPGVPTSSLNLAAPLADGEQVVLDGTGPVGAAPAAGAATPPAGAAGAGPGAFVNLNTATLAELDGLPGVGPVLAQRILDWRSEHGRFTTVEELQEVPGIGPSKFEDMKAHVRV